MADMYNQNFRDVAFSRRSVRRYSKKKVDNLLLEQIIEVAVSAPSAHNAQPWHYLVITAEETKSQLIHKMAERFEQDMRKQMVSPQSRQARLERSLTIFGEAPVLIVVFLIRERLKQIPFPYKKLEEKMALQSVAVSIGYLQLAATASGLGSCWFAAPLFCQDVVLEALNIQNKGWEPQALLTLGFPAEEPYKKRGNRALEAMRTFLNRPF